MFWTKFKFIGHSVKNVTPSQKTLRPPWRPKLVTGLSSIGLPYFQRKKGVQFTIVTYISVLLTL